MSYRVIINSTAKKEIEQAYRWLSRYSPQGAMLWHFDLAEAIASLEEMPLRCALAPENDAFKKELRQRLCGKYRIIFTIKDEEVQILHVRHSSREPLKPKRPGK